MAEVMAEEVMVAEEVMGAGTALPQKPRTRESPPD